MNIAPKLHDKTVAALQKMQLECSDDPELFGIFDYALAALSPPSGEGVELPSAEDWLSGGTSYAVASPEWKAGWNAARNRLRSLTTPQSAPVDGGVLSKLSGALARAFNAGSFGARYNLDQHARELLCSLCREINDSTVAMACGVYDGTVGDESICDIAGMRAALEYCNTMLTAPKQANHIGEIVTGSDSPTGMNVIRWVEGFTPQVGMKLFASEHKHDLMHNVETDIVTCRGCDYRSTPPPASQERGGEIPETMFHGAGAYAQFHYCKRYSRDPATLSDRAPACECGKEHGWSGSFVPPTPESTFAASPPSSACQKCGSNITFGAHDEPGSCAAEQAKPDDCPFCGREGKHYGEEVCPALNNPNTFTLAEQAQAGEVWRYIWNPMGMIARDRKQFAESDATEYVTLSDYNALRSRLAGGVTVDDAMFALREIVAEADKNPFSPIGHVIEHVVTNVRVIAGTVTEEMVSSAANAYVENGKGGGSCSHSAMRAALVAALGAK